MNRAISSILFTGLICVGAQAFADDAKPASTSASAMSDSTTAQSQTMKDCIAAQKAKDSTKSNADVTKACKDAAKLPVEKNSADHPKDSQTTSPKP
jgi:hypothetical protein